MARFEIPLTPEAQTFTIALAGKPYRLTIHWGSATNAWLLDVATVDGVTLLASISLVTGVDLLGPYGYMNFGGRLIAETDSEITAPPTYENLGLNGRVYFIIP